MQHLFKSMHRGFTQALNRCFRLRDNINPCLPCCMGTCWNLIIRDENVASVQYKMPWKVFENEQNRVILINGWP